MNNKQHVMSRLNERGLGNVDYNDLAYVASRCSHDTAVLLMVLKEHRGDNTNEYHSRTESNGNMVVMIVRNRQPMTIMYRRENQPFTPKAMNVVHILDITPEGYYR